MEKNNENGNFAKVRGVLTGLAPYIAIAIFLIGIAISLAGPYFRVKLDEGGETVTHYYGLIDMISNASFKPSLRSYFIVIYLGFPVLSAILIVLGRFNTRFYTAATILLLFSGVNSIASGYVINYVFTWSAEPAKIQIWGVLPIVCFFVSALMTLVINGKEESFTISDITEAGITVALAFIFNLITFFKMPTGGSVNLQMLPLFIYAIRRGPLKGFVTAGIIFGLLTCLTDGYGIATFPFDYLLGIGSVAIVGFFGNLILGKDQKNYNLKGEIFIFVGCAIASAVRFAAGSVSSMLLYGYELDAAALYNVGYVFVSGGIATVAIMALYGPLARVNSFFPVKSVEVKGKEENKESSLEEPKE